MNHCGGAEEERQTEEAEENENQAGNGCRRKGG